MGTELGRHGLDWVRYAQGQATLVKVALLLFGFASPAAVLPALWGALVVGSLISHAPGWVRHYALWGADGPCRVKALEGEPPR